MTTWQQTFENEAGGTLAYNVMHFVRGLRGAGLPAGPGKTIEAVRAVEAVDPIRRSDLYWALHAVLVERRDQHDLFDQAFRLFWREVRMESAVPGPVMATAWGWTLWVNSGPPGNILPGLKVPLGAKALRTFSMVSMSSPVNTKGM